MADVIELITKDHRELEKLFAKLKRGPKNREAVLEQVSVLLSAHSRAEEEQVYPAVAREAGEREEAHHGAEEHHEAEQLLKKLRLLPPDGENFDRQLERFVSAVAHHIEEEEGDILPALGKAVSKQRLRQLGVAFAEHRARGMDTGKKRGPTASGAGRKPAKAVDERTKEELYQEARKLEVSGRSTMSKKQLATAIDKARSAR